jgi:G3E family GTPase
MLGSGKTTFIGHFVRNIKGKAVVLVNDFGKAGIDGEIFSAGGVESIELPSGCVCCTLKFDLITTIEKIVANLAPEHLLIEPSGIASPSGILEALDALGLSPVTVVGIVDATEFMDYSDPEMFGRFFEDQLINSDVVLVNKTDLADTQTTDRTVEAVETMNPNAIVFRTVNCVTDSFPDVRVSEKVIDRQAPHLHFETVSLKLGDDLDMEAVGNLFHAMSTGRFGDIVRAKALVNTLQGPYKFDLSFTNVQSVPFGKTVSGSRLVVIGRDIRRDRLSAHFPGYIHEEGSR